jgi:hypothetical protein
MKRIDRKRNSQRGSALLASLMVMVGLSLLGLAFVTISETEGAISMNQRNLTQVQQVAETGAKFAIEWFQDPDWATAQNLMPANTDAIKPERNFKTNPADTTAIKDRYKQDAGTKLFDTPFKPNRVDRFYGSEKSPDVVINGSTNQAFLNQLNAKLFVTPDLTGRITDIRVYAPPMVSALENADGYWEGGVRLGVATVQVTATKCRNDSATTPCTSTDDPDRIIAQKTVRAVLSEWPFPGPSGPVQTNANLNTSGNLQVHWGKITATGGMALKRPFGGMPWHDAHNRVNFERGYIDPAVGAAHNPWPTNPASTEVYDKYNWLWELVERPLQDPWYEAWSRGDYAGDGVAGPYQPWPYVDPTDPAKLYTIGIGNDTCNICRNIFQFQTVDQYPDIKSVLFPRIDYDFWKDIARAGDDQDTIFYLQWVNDVTFRDRNGIQKTVLDWIDVEKGAVAGFYFFDTKDGVSPQNTPFPTNLTPTVKVAAWKGQMAGFIYLNSEMWDASGAGGGGPAGRYNMPGEPFRDIGHWEVLADGSDWVKDGFGNPVLKDGTANNGEWDYEDVNDNKKFDYKTASRTVTRDGGGDVTTYFLIPWTPGCTPGSNCSEPHEPYLNFQYPLKAGDPVKVGWQNGVGTKRPKKTSNGTPTGTAINCGSAPEGDCTSNGYDRDGAIVTLEPSLNGVFYIEGTFEQTGNYHYFGSILIQGDASKAGTPDVWFDERLIKGEWPPKEFKFPRVYISSMQSD